MYFLFQEYTIENLNTYTQYLVSLRVFNPEGNGPETIVVVMTDEGGKNTNLKRFHAISKYEVLQALQS